MMFKKKMQNDFLQYTLIVDLFSLLVIWQDLLWFFF